MKATVDDARKKADGRAAQLRAKNAEAADQAERQWNQVQTDSDKRVNAVESTCDGRKAEIDAGLAEDDAQWAEADAYDAVTFAESAIEEAQYAVLDAVMARRRAKVMAAAT